MDFRFEDPKRTLKWCFRKQNENFMGFRTLQHEIQEFMALKPLF